MTETTYDLHIPTAELIGLLSDTIPFACGPDTPPLNVIRLEWDGEMLHALATDRWRIAIASWHPDDSPDDAVRQDDLFTRWGGTTETWAANVWLDDAKEVVKVFKLPAKQGGTPLVLTVRTGPGGTLTVVRRPESGHSALTATFETVKEEFPDVRAHLVSHSTLEPVDGLAFDAAKLADLAKVRQRGATELSFTGQHTLCYVRIGERFVGAVMPVLLEEGG